MDIENPIALHFLMQDELYLLNKDKTLYSNTDLPVAGSAHGVADIAPVTAATPDFKYLGGKKKNFLILVHYEDIEFIAEAHLTALESILKRKGLAIDDVAIFNMAKYSAVSFEELTSYFNPQKILLLGKNALPEGITPLKLNIPHQLAACMALYSFSFDEMMDSNENKKVFWEQMKLL